MNFLALTTSTADWSAAAGVTLFYLFAALSVVSALSVAVSKNIVRAAVGLLMSLLGVAGLYFLLHAEFLAAVQLVVYAGGTLILIVFGIMLTSKSPFSHYEPKTREVVIAIGVGMVLLAAIVGAILSGPFAVVGVETEGYPITQLGQALLGDYLVPFELASVLLLAVMIGAAYLAKSRRRES